MQGIWAATLDVIKKNRSYPGLFHLMEQYGDHVSAEITGADNEIFKRTYSEACDMAYSVCGNLQTAGSLEKGDVVGLIYDTCMDWPVLFWGILMAGGIPLLLNPGADAPLLVSIMEEAHAAAYVSARPVEGAKANWIHASEVLGPGPRGKEVWGEYTALCTSGTTGTSRIFLYSAEAITAQLIAFDEVYNRNEELAFTENAPFKMLAFLPFHHVFGFSVVYMLYSCMGRTIVYLRDKSVQTILSACRNHGVTHIYCVPMLYNALAMAIHHNFCAMTGMSDEQFAAFCDDSIRKRSEAAAVGREAPLPPQLQMLQSSLLGTQIRSLITGGGHIPEETLRILNASGYDLYNGFGMTECGIIGVETSKLASRRIKGSIGKPMDVIEYRFDPEGAEEGELLIRGEILYTASMKDGRIVPRDKKEWFHTGDIARSDGEGLYIAGRCKDVIVNASGENIYPDILEDAFAAIPGTARICILGIRNGQYEDVSLLVEPAEGFDETVLVTAVDRINAGLAPYNRVSRILISAKPIPVSASLKVRRQPLKKAIEEGTWEFREAQSTPSDRKESTETVPAAYREEEFIRVRDKIRRIMAEELYLDEEEIDYDAHFTTELGGDSLTLYSAVCAIEKEFGIVILDSEIRTLFTVNDTARFVLAKQHGENTVLRQEDKTGGTNRITDFTKSTEYLELQKRREETVRDGVNPYFVPHDSLIRDTSIIDGQKVINLGSYNYLGMSGDPETMQAAIDAVKMYGTSASGSRTLAGEKTLYQQLERCIADWKHTEDCIVCTGGWATNLSFISCFMRKGDFILYDKLSHNSIEDGVRLSEADSKAFGHNDFEMLEKTLKAIQGKYNKVLIVVEGVYSMDGDIAPIPEFVRLKEQYGCFLMVDEAHSGGVIGDHGGGVDDYFHLKPHDIDIKMGTLSKALGTCGGYIAADHSIVEYLRYSMDGFVFTAGIAPPLAAACMKAVEIIRRDNTAVTKLHRNIEYFTRLALEAGMDIGLAGKTAIVPVLIGSDAEAAKISNMLMKRGVFAPPAMYPAVPMGKSRIRFTVSSTHSEEQLDKAIRELADIMRSEGLLK